MILSNRSTPSAYNKVAKIDLISALAEVWDIPYLDCTRVQVSPEALKLIPQAMARHCNALPIAIQDSSLIVAMAEPQNLQLLDELRFKSGKKIVPRLGFRSEIALAIDRHWRCAINRTRWPPRKIFSDWDFQTQWPAD